MSSLKKRLLQLEEKSRDKETTLVIWVDDICMYKGNVNTYEELTTLYHYIKTMSIVKIY